MYPSRKQISYNNRTKKMRGGSVPESEVKTTGEKVSEVVSNGVQNLQSTISTLVDPNTYLGPINSTLETATNTYAAIKNTEEQVVNTITNPDLPHLVGDVSKKVVNVLEEAKPAISEVTDVVGEAVANAVNKQGSKITKATTGAIFNGIGAIPGAGLPVDILRIAEKTSEGAEAAIDAFKEVADATKKAINIAVPQKGGAERIILKNRKNTAKTMKMVGGSIAEFMDSTLNPSFFLQTGGKGIRESKRRRHFSKRRSQ